MSNVREEDLHKLADILDQHVFQFALANRIPAEAICAVYMFALVGRILGLAQGNEKVVRDMIMEATQKALAKMPEIQRRARKGGSVNGG